MKDLKDGKFAKEKICAANEQFEKEAAESGTGRRWRMAPTKSKERQEEVRRSKEKARRGEEKKKRRKLQRRRQ